MEKLVVHDGRIKEAVVVEPFASVADPRLLEQLSAGLRWQPAFF